jgi:hypothetical protein
MQDKHVVIVHYNEDRDILINKIDMPHTIYHKGNNPQPGDIVLKNIGKEAYAYVWHIIENYDNLPEYTIFAQANPDEHVHEFLLAIRSTFTSGYGSLGYARSIYAQYGQSLDISIPIVPLARKLGFNFANNVNCTKFMFFVNPGCIFYLHRDRIRQYSKSFYENLLSYCDDDVLHNMLLEEEYPSYYWADIWKMYPKLRGLPKDQQLLKLADRRTDLVYNMYSCVLEALWWTIFQTEETRNLINTAAATKGNKLNFSSGTSYNSNLTVNKFPFTNDIGSTKMNFKLLENDAFDWSCPNYLKWREALVEKTIFEGSKFNFNPQALLEYYNSIGYKHITL